MLVKRKDGLHGFVELYLLFLGLGAVVMIGSLTSLNMVRRLQHKKRASHLLITELNHRASQNVTDSSSGSSDFSANGSTLAMTRIKHTRALNLRFFAGLLDKLPRSFVAYTNVKFPNRTYTVSSLPKEFKLNVHGPAEQVSPIEDQFQGAVGDLDNDLVFRQLLWTEAVQKGTRKTMLLTMLPARFFK